MPDNCACCGTAAFRNDCIPSAKNWTMVLGIKSGAHANPGFLDLWLLELAHLSTFETIPGHGPLSATSGARDHHIHLP